MNKKTIAAVSVFVFALSIVSIFPAQQVSAQVTTTCPVGFTCVATGTPVLTLTATPIASSPSLPNQFAFKLKFDGTTYDPSVVTIQLSCPTGISVVAIDNMGTSPSLCDHYVNPMARVQDGLYTINLQFMNTSGSAQNVSVTANFYGGGATPVATAQTSIQLLSPGTTVTSPSCYVFSNSLTIGSVGQDVTALQQFLVANGFMTMSAGVAMGTFDANTSTALGHYQAAVGLPVTGFLGPITIAKLNACGPIGGTTTTVPVCPAGFVCGPTTPPTVPYPPVVPVSDATAAIQGNGSLVLSYSAPFKESQLTATYNISVNGGSTGMNVFQYAIGMTFVDQKGNNYDNLNSEVTKVSSTSNLPLLTDAYGRAYFGVQAHKTATFKIVSTVNAQDLYGSSYYAQLPHDISTEFGTSTLYQTSVKIQRDSNSKTNTVVVIGETAAVISSVTDPFTPGKPLVIKGIRLNGANVLAAVFSPSTVYVDGTAVNPRSVVFSADGTSATVNLPSNFTFASGKHTVYITNSFAGNSNVVSFTLMNQGTPTTPIVPVPSVSVNIINKSVPSTDGTMNITLSIQSTQNDSYIDHWVLTYQCGNGITLSTGKIAGVLCGASQSPLPLTYSPSSVNKDGQNYSMFTGTARNNASVPAVIDFVLTAYNKAGTAIGNGKYTIQIMPLQSVGNPVTSPVVTASPTPPATPTTSPAVPAPVVTPNVSISLDWLSPISSLVRINGANPSPVLLGIFDITSLNATTSLQSITTIINTTGGSVSSAMTGVQLRSGDKVIGTGTFGPGSGANTNSASVSFTNLNLPLIAHLYVPISVYGIVTAATNNVSIKAGLTFDGKTVTQGNTIKITNGNQQAAATPVPFSMGVASVLVGLLGLIGSFI